MCFLLPYILKVLAVRSNNREAGFERSIKACGADQDIDGVLVAIATNTAPLGDVGDFAVDHLDILLAERLEVTHAWCESSAADVPVRDQALLEVWVMQFLLHLRLYVGFGLMVGGGSLEENAELAVQAALDVPSVFKKHARFRCEFKTLLVGEDVLLETLYGRHPCGLADESGYFVNLGLDGGEDLDTGGSASVREAYLSERSKGLPIPNKANMSAGEVDIVVPIRGVEKSTLVLVQARYGRPPPIVQDSRGIDQDIAVVGDFLAALQVFDGNIVSTFLMVPAGANDLVLNLDIFVEGVFPGEVIEILENLPATGIDSGPVELRLKGPGVVVRRNIAGTAIPRKDMFPKLACCSSRPAAA